MCTLINPIATCVLCCLSFSPPADDSDILHDDNNNNSTSVVAPSAISDLSQDMIKVWTAPLLLVLHGL